MYRLIKKIQQGQGTFQDIDELERVARSIEGRTICALGEAAAWPVLSMLKHFRSEFEEKVNPV